MKKNTNKVIIVLVICIICFGAGFFLGTSKGGSISTPIAGNIIPGNNFNEDALELVTQNDDVAVYYFYDSDYSDDYKKKFFIAVDRKKGGVSIITKYNN